MSGNWSDILSQLAEEAAQDPASILAQFNQTKVNGPGATPAPVSFDAFKQQSEFDNQPVESRQRIYDDFVERQLPRMLPAGVNEEQRDLTIAEFQKLNPRPEAESILDSLVSGFKRGFEVPDVGRAAALGLSPEQIAAQVVDRAELDQVMTPELRQAQGELAEKMAAFNESEGFGNASAAALQVLGALAFNPVQTAGMLGESLGGSMPAMAGAGIGGAVGGPVGLIVGLVAGNTASNVQMAIGQRVLDKLTEAKVDQRDEAAVLTALRANPQWVSEAVQKGGTEGVATAAVESAVDVATFGVSKVLRPAKSLLQTVGRTSAAIAAQGGAEAGGSGAGKAAVGEEIDPAELLVEGLLGAIAGVPDAALALGGGSRLRKQDDTAGRNPDPDVEVVEGDGSGPLGPLLALPAPAATDSPIFVSPDGQASTDAASVAAQRADPSGITVTTDPAPEPLALPAPGAANPTGQPVLTATPGGLVGDDPLAVRSAENQEETLDELLARLDSQRPADGETSDPIGTSPADASAGVPGDGATATGGDVPGDSTIDTGPADSAGFSPDEQSAIRSVIDRIERATTGTVSPDGTATGQPQAGGRSPAGAGGIGADQTSGSPGPDQPATAGGNQDGGAGSQPELILQNRDRSSAASVTQMAAIAGNPDYMRLSPSRSLAEGAPVVIAEANLPADQLGKTDQAVDANGKRVGIRYAVVEAADLLTSHDANGNPIAGYERGEVGKMRAVAGNGRIAGLQAAYEAGNAGEYQSLMSEDFDAHGVDPDVVSRFEQPVLIRMMDQADVTADIGDRTNTTGVSRLSPIEQAANDARRVDLSKLDFTANGTPTIEAVTRFIQGMPPAERGELLDTNNQPARQAFDRLQNAIFKAAYDNDEIVNLFAAATDPEARNVVNALAAVAPEAAKLKGAGELDLRPFLIGAAELAVNARRRGIKLIDLVSNADMTVPVEALEVARIIAENARSGKAMTERLHHLVGLAVTETENGDVNLFGTVEKPSVMDLIEMTQQPDVALFSRSSEPGATTGMRPSLLGDLVRKIVSDWVGAPPVVVVPTMNHSRVPESVRQAAMRSGAGQAEAFFHDGKVWLLADQLNSQADVARVMAHESLGHFGLARTFGPRLRTVLNQVIASHREQVERRVRDEGLDPANEAAMLIGAEEHLAYLAQTNPTTGLVKRAVSAIREFFRRFGADLALTEADVINSILAPARRTVVDGATANSPFLGHILRTPQFSRQLGNRLPGQAMRAEPTEFARLGTDRDRQVLSDLYDQALDQQDGFRDQMDAIASEIGGTLMMGPMKTPRRAIDKILKDYKGDPSRIKDLVRGTIMIDDLADGARTIEAIKRRFAVLPSGQRNLLDTSVPVEDGYRDAKFNVRLDNGLVAEVQVNVPEMLEAKGGQGHDLYEQREALTRSIVDREPTAEERARINELNAQMRALYEAATQAALARAASTSDRNSGSLNELPSSRTYSADSPNGRGGSASQAATYGPELAPTETGTPSTSQSEEPFRSNISSTSDSSIPASQAVQNTSVTNETITGSTNPEGNPDASAATPRFSRREPFDPGEIARRDIPSVYQHTVRQAQAQGFQSSLFGPDGEVQPDAAGPAGLPGNLQPTKQVPPTVALRRVAELAVPAGPVRTNASAATFFAALRRSPREQFHVLVLDENDMPVSYHRHAVGEIAATSVYPLELAQHVFSVPGARKIYIAHNHPSDTTDPSQADVNLTRMLSGLFNARTGVDLMGHVIIGGTNYRALNASGNTSGKARAIPPRLRSERLAIDERVFLRRPKAVIEKISNTTEAAAAVGKLLPDSNGVLLMGNQNQIYDTHPMTIEQMRQLGGTGEFGRMVRALGRINANTALVASTDEAAAANVAAALRKLEVRVLQAGKVNADGTLEYVEPAGTFFSRKPAASTESPIEVSDGARRIAEFKKGSSLYSREIPQGFNLQQLTNWLRAETDGRDRLVADLVPLVQSEGLAVPNGNGSQFASPDLDSPGKWRITSFDKNNQPFGHYVVNTPDEAVRDLINAADVKQIEAGGPVRFSRAAADQTETEAFKRWFDGSQATDANGKPLVVYHGSPDARFMDDDATFRDRWKGTTAGVHWFTPSQRAADTYADDTRAFDYQRAEPRVIPAFLSLKNPLVIDAQGAYWRDAQRRGRTSDVIEQAQEEGRDGVIIRNVKDDYNNNGRTTTIDTFAVFDSTQIKSATDNNGDFDPANPSILFSRAAPAPGVETIDVDGVARARHNSNGRPVAPSDAAVRNFWRWFGDSRAVDNQGRPLVAYRGEHGATGKALNTRVGSFVFTPDPEVASTYASSPNRRDLDGDTGKAARVIPAYLRIERPFIEADDPFIDVSVIADKLGEAEARRAALSHAADIEGTGHWIDDLAEDFDSVADLLAKAPERINELYFDAYKYLDTPQAQAAIKSAGFDGAIHDGNGEGALVPELRVFDQKAVKSVIGNAGTFNRDEADIRFSRRGPGSRVPGDPRSTETFKDVRDVMRFAETLRLPPRTLGDVAIRERDPATAAKIYARGLTDVIAESFADQLRPAVRWLEALPIARDIKRAIEGGIRRAHGMRGALEKEAEDAYGRPMRIAIRKLAKKYKMGTDQAMELVGYWMTANYAPQQNQYLLDKDDRAIGELQTELDQVRAEFAAAQSQGSLLPQNTAPIEQRIDKLIDDLNKRRAARAKRAAAINHPDPYHSTDDIGLAAGMSNASAAKIKADFEAKVPEAEIRAVAK